MNIIIHTKDDCPWCDLAKEWLSENGFEFETVIHNDSEERQKFYETCGNNVKSVPQIFLDGNRIGGYGDLIEYKDELLVTKTNFDEDF